MPWITEQTEYGPQTIWVPDQPVESGGDTWGDGLLFGDFNPDYSGDDPRGDGGTEGRPGGRNEGSIPGTGAGSGTGQVFDDPSAWWDDEPAAQEPTVIVSTDSDPASASAQSSGGGSSSGGGDSRPNPSNYSAPGVPSLRPSPHPLRPWEERFTAPTMEEALDSPGFKFRLGEGLKALERSAASRGTLLTGGTLKGLQNYGQESASQEYDKVYGRKYNEYDTRRRDFLTNEANRYTSERYNLQDQFGMESDIYGMNRSNRLDNWGISSDYFNMGRANRQDDMNQGNMTFAQMLALANLTKPPSPYGFDY
jgi:hypothetical protein